MVIWFDLHDIVLQVGVSHSFKLHCEELRKGIPEVTCNPEVGADITCTPVEGLSQSRVKHAEAKQDEREHILIGSEP